MAHLRASDWENPCVIGINKKRPHVQLRSFTHPQQAWRHFDLPASSQTVAQSPRIFSLNGEDWGFKLHGSPEAVPAEFSQQAFQEDGGWSKVGLDLRGPSFGQRQQYPCMATNPLPCSMVRLGTSEPLRRKLPCLAAAGADYRAHQLGVSGPRPPAVHQFCVPYPGGPPLCPRRKPHWLLPPGI
jgi:hypothetical protein